MNTVLEPTLEVSEPVSTIITVNREAEPVYPRQWMKRVMHPELELLGPSEYEVSTVKLWKHEGQSGKTGGRLNEVQGKVVYDYLLANPAMHRNCFGLRDLEVIEPRGVRFFQEHFQDKTIYAWKAVVTNEMSSLGELCLFVPCLCVRNGNLHRNWFSLSLLWQEKDFAAYFEESMTLTESEFPCPLG